MKKTATGGSMIYGFLIIQIVICSLAWPYTINAWLVFFGKVPAIVWWQGALIGFVPYFNKVTLSVAFVTWLLMLFL